MKRALQPAHFRPRILFGPYGLLAAVLLAACAVQAPGPSRTPERHAANVAAAGQAGYKIVTSGDRTLFCPTASPTGSHMAPSCMSESQFESLVGAPRSTSPAMHVTNTHPGPGPGAGH